MGGCLPRRSCFLVEEMLTESGCGSVIELSHRCPMLVSKLAFSTASVEQAARPPCGTMKVDSQAVRAAAWRVVLAVVRLPRAAPAAAGAAATWWADATPFRHSGLASGIHDMVLRTVLFAGACYEEPGALSLEREA